MTRKEIQELRQLAHDVTHQTLHGPLSAATAMRLAGGVYRLAKRCDALEAILRALVELDARMATSGVDADDHEAWLARARTILQVDA